MTDIKLNKLKIENFKCHKLLSIDFCGRSMSIYGDNATGKTSIYDSLLWLLFSKDSLGNGEKNFEVKPLNAAGEVEDHQAITSVEAEFAVNGVGKTFRRTYREVWATKRGTGEPEYTGNTSDYFVDGVPMKKNAFDDAIREMVGEERFRMLTSVAWFSSGMKWQERRAVLFELAGAMSDKDIMAGNPQFQSLLDSVGSMNLGDYKAKLLYQKKGLTGTRDDAPTRISECGRTLDRLQGLDFDAARAQEAELTEQREELAAQSRGGDQSLAIGEKRLEVQKLQLEKEQLMRENLAYRKNQENAFPDLGRLEGQLRQEKARLDSCRNFLNVNQRSVQRFEDEIQHSREVYVQVNGESFAGGKCPTCGQDLPFEQLQKATAQFEQKKARQLEAIMRQAESMKEQKQAAQVRVEETEEEIRQRQAAVEALEQEIQAAKSQRVEVRDMEDYAQRTDKLNGQIQAMEQEIASMAADGAAALSELRWQLEGLDIKIRENQRILAQEAVKEQTLARIEELKADAKNASQALEAIEQMLYLMEEFTRYKARFVEESINSHFRLAKFRLFREQANGGVEERCDVVYDGVPFMGLNNGMKVNVGIDIINTLSRHYGIHVPLFIDNAEAVTRLEDSTSQVIRLVVSEEDKELRIV